MSFVVPPPPVIAVPVVDDGLFPVRRIFCIGRNYADHVKEMGGDPKSDPPVFFTKPADSVVQSGATIPFPQATSNFHYEGELVVALKSGGRDIPSPEAAKDAIFGFACGCDLTRRDLQAAAKRAGAPWDASKGFDNSAAIGPITRMAGGLWEFVHRGHVRLSLNGEWRQDAPVASMIWAIPEIVVALSKFFELKAGDLIFTGTPDGVGPLAPGDRVSVQINALAPLDFSIGAKA